MTTISMYRQATVVAAVTAISTVVFGLSIIVVGQEPSTSGPAVVQDRSVAAVAVVNRVVDESAIYCGARSSDRRFLLVGERNVVTFWDLQKGEVTLRLECPKREVPYRRWVPGVRGPGSTVKDSSILTPAILAVALSPDHRQVLIATNLDTTLWDLEAAELLHTLNVTTFRGDPRTRRSAPREAVTAIHFSADGKTVLIGGLRHHIQLFDVASGEFVASPKTMAYKAKFYPGTEEILVLSETGGLYHMGGAGEGRRELEEANLGKMGSWPAFRQPFEFSDDGTRLLCARKQEGIVLDAESGDVLYRFEEARLRREPRAVDLSADGNLALICWSIGLSVYDVEEGTHVATIGDYPSDKFWGGFFSADGESVYSWGSQDGQAALLEWNLADQTLKRRMLPIAQRAEPTSDARSDAKAPNSVRSDRKLVR